MYSVVYLQSTSVNYYMYLCVLTSQGYIMIDKRVTASLYHVYVTDSNPMTRGAYSNQESSVCLKCLSLIISTDKTTDEVYG